MRIKEGKRQIKGCHGQTAEKKMKMGARKVEGSKRQMVQSGVKDETDSEGRCTEQRCIILTHLLPVLVQEARPRLVVPRGITTGSRGGKSDAGAS